MALEQAHDLVAEVLNVLTGAWCCHDRPSLLSTDAAKWLIDKRVQMPNICLHGIYSRSDV